MPAKKSRDAAVSKLRSALNQIELKSSAGTVSPAVLGNIKGLVEEAIDLIQVTDPLKKRVSMIVLLLQESTEIRSEFANGMDHEHVWVKDRELYNWAIRDVHRLLQEAA